MKLSNPILFLIPALIWGSTFFVIKFQVGTVPPIWSVSYRFILAGLILLLYCVFTQKNLKYSAVVHLRMLLQGALLFGFNYWLVYIAELELTSGLVAVAFSCIIFMNIIFQSIFLERKTEPKVFMGAFLGVGGTSLLFYQDLGGLDQPDFPLFSLGVCILSVVVASLGNITSAFNQSLKIPVIQTNAFGMLYGGLLMAVIALVTNVPFQFLSTFDYIGSLLYLSIFGSIIAFGSYLTLIGKIGPDKAAYVLIVIPGIAIVLSYLFEDFRLTALVGVGMILILGGNYIVLKK